MERTVDGGEICPETSFLVFFPQKNARPERTSNMKKIPQIMHFLFLHPCLIENSVHYSSGKFLPSTIRPLSLRLGKGL